MFFSCTYIGTGLLAVIPAAQTGYFGSACCGPIVAQSLHWGGFAGSARAEPSRGIGNAGGASVTLVVRGCLSHSRPLRLSDPHPKDTNEATVWVSPLPCLVSPATTLLDTSQPDSRHWCWAGVGGWAWLRVGGRCVFWEGRGPVCDGSPACSRSVQRQFVRFLAKKQVRCA